MSDKRARRVIRLFPDYGHRWPLWENSTAERPTKYTMEPADFGLSQNLTSRLRTWYDAWDAEVLYEYGWGSPENEAAWKEEGASIAMQLREEVKTFADVEYEE
ncbi:hypothetical protein CVV68_14375 [Arthrobacter livingstonensis]|uniref:Uncharacterized protein n=1 Tax=Arthrobacter livingstonensis TaxID=670078 RepID=A0A2V5L5J9_9MICC|nr:hypothetical protein [Arthrobacter livingstonensis]PYI66468.1 hypothetical protein CVV68_14375 [Arthrobacter livingstonensis]